MRKLVLDRQGIPTGEEEPFGGFDSCVDERDFDDGFALPEEEISFSVKGAGRRVSVELLAGYRYAQVFAPKDQDYIALEPMTAPAGALTSSRGLRLVQPGQNFRTAFRIFIGTAR
jgi:galactose mutarotase-like enzyme